MRTKKSFESDAWDVKYDAFSPTGGRHVHVAEARLLTFGLYYSISRPGTAGCEVQQLWIPDILLKFL